MPRQADSAADRGKADVRHTDFVNALTNPHIDPPAGIMGPDGQPAVKRFNVYRNNVTVSLIGALADTFPAVRRLVGENFFQAMARVYIQAEPPGSPLLFEYGRGFADFIRTFEPARDIPYLPDVARLERAWLDAYHAADAEPLQADTLGSVQPERLATLRFQPHPAAAIVRSPYAAVSIFSANRQDGPSPAINPSAPEDGLVSRPGADVIVRRLPPGAAIFFQSLLDGQTLGDCAGAAVSEAADFDLAAAISAMLEAGVAVEIADHKMPDNKG